MRTPLVFYSAAKPPKNKQKIAIDKPIEEEIPIKSTYQDYVKQKKKIEEAFKKAD